MKNILNKEDLCGYFPEVVLRPASRLVPAVATLVGLIVLVWASSLTEADTLSAALLTVGIVILAYGVIKLIRPSRTLYYLPTGEKLSRHFEGHEQDMRSEVDKALVSGDFEALGSLKAQNSSAPLVTVTYTTPSGSLRIGQALHYVPYEYVPLMEPVVHKK
ncbi:MAG: hypothetical protein IJZ09_04340 [Tidjanibacter sp.]|nr:hypothetical protein [Tidjanibacter sp.]